MSPLRLAMLAQAIGRPTDFAAWEALLDTRLAEAVGNNAELLVLPEYGCVELAATAITGPDLAGELAVITGLADRIVTAWRDAARRHRIWLLPGSLPMPRADGVRNMAPLIAPDGRMAFQEKRVMTRFEDEQWGIGVGAPPSVFETPWGRIGIAICFDVEFPTLVRAQIEAGAWLILAPSCTDTLAGFNRVRLSARARALENQCFVAIAPTVGDAPWLATLDENHGAAGVFGPVDRGFAADGIVAEGSLDTPGWVYADLDPARIDAVRRDGQVRNHRSWPAAPPAARVLIPA